MVLDDIDKKLLNLLQGNNLLSAEALAMMVGSSRSSVQRRLKKLRQGGAIAADISILSPEVTGQKIQAIINVKLDSVHGDLLDDFRQSMLDLDAVQQCYYVTGEVDFIVILALDSMRDYDDISRRYFANVKNVRRYHASIVADQVKMTHAIPL